MKKAPKIKDFEHACKLLKLDPKTRDILSALPEEFRDSAIAHYELMIITKAANNSVPANYYDESEWKYEPRFWIKATKENPAGVGFSRSDYVNWYSASSVGSRLSSRSSATCMDLAKRFEAKYKALLLPPIKK